MAGVRKERSRRATETLIRRAAVQDDMPSPLLQAALYYAKRGWPVFPACWPDSKGNCGCGWGHTGRDIGKAPRTPNGLKDATTDQGTIKEWWRRYPSANVAVATGSGSSLGVLDVDSQKGGENSLCDLGPLPKTVVAITGGGGRHYFFADSKAPCKTGLLQGLDFRGVGGYVIAPPSPHISGRKYEWEAHPDDVSLAPLPDSIHQLLAPQRGRTYRVKKDWADEALAGVPKGQRDDTCARLVGRYVSLGLRDNEIVSPVLSWNTRNSPPMGSQRGELDPGDWIRDKIARIRAKDSEIGVTSANLNRERMERGNQGERLVKLALGSGAVFFVSQLGEAYCATHGDGREVVKIHSRSFRRWLGKLMWEAERNVPNRESLEAALLHLEAQAHYGSQVVPLEVRVAAYGSAIWYDLGREAVRITAQGWEIVNHPPVLFNRFPHQRPQIMPTPGGKLESFLEFTRVKDERDRLLLLAWLVAALIPGFPHPALGVAGDHGAAKSFLQKLIKWLIDPSAILTFGPPDNRREFVQQASHHWFIFLDNMSSLRWWLSDALCRLITGEGFSKRELYSDDDDVIYSLQRVVGLNGINLVIERPDLLDRSLLISLERVPDDERLEEAELWASFDQAKPGILGAAFDVLSKAMALHPTLNNIKGLPRMADFGRWGEAVSRALGHAPGDFLKAYDVNVGRQNEEAVDASPVAQAIIALIESTVQWEGSPTELLNRLLEGAEALKLDTRGRSWPKDPRWLWRRINEAKANLLALGIEAKCGTTGSGRYTKRFIRLSRTISENDVSVVSDVSISAAGDANDVSPEQMTFQPRPFIDAGETIESRETTLSSIVPTQTVDEEIF